LRHPLLSSIRHASDDPVELSLGEVVLAETVVFAVTVTMTVAATVVVAVNVTAFVPHRPASTRLGSWKNPHPLGIPICPIEFGEVHAKIETVSQTREI
jgi:hypothetical protein